MIKLYSADYAVCLNHHNKHKILFITTNIPTNPRSNQHKENKQQCINIIGGVMVKALDNGIVVSEFEL